MCEFRDHGQYTSLLLEKRQNAKKQICDEFSKRGHNNVYCLDESYAMELRNIFQSNPTFKSALSHIANAINLPQMFSQSLCEGSLKKEQKLSLVEKFKLTCNEKLSSFVRSAVRSLWLYGYVVLFSSDCSGFPQVATEEDYIVFRTDCGTLHARDMEGKNVDLVVRDYPNANGRVNSPVSYLYESAMRLKEMKNYELESARHACRHVIVLGKKDLSDPDKSGYTERFQDIEQNATKYAISALLSDSADVGDRRCVENDRMQLKSEVKMLQHEVKLAREQNMNMRRVFECGDWRKGADNAWTERVLIHTGDEEKVETSKFCSNTLNIQSAVDEFNSNVKNVLLGTLAYHDTNTLRGSGSTVVTERALLQCVSSLQEFIVYNMLSSWSANQGISLCPSIEKLHE